MPDKLVNICEYKDINFIYSSGEYFFNLYEYRDKILNGFNVDKCNIKYDRYLQDGEVYVKEKDAVKLLKTVIDDPLFKKINKEEQEEVRELLENG